MPPDLRPDDRTEHCLFILEFMAWFFIAKFHRGAHAWADLTNWQESKRMRNDRAKAERRGYTTAREWLTPNITADVRSIYNSKPVRQGRAIKLLAIRPQRNTVLHVMAQRWPCDDYRIYTCPEHWLGFWGVRQNGRLVAFAEMVRAGNMATPLSAIGHAAHLSNGVMNALFSGFMTDLRSDGVERLLFGSDKALHEGSMGLFMRGAGITNTEPFEPSGLMDVGRYANV